MLRTIEGRLRGDGVRVAVVAARFNESVTDRLVQGALDALRRHGVAETAIVVVRVPGSFELPLAVKAAAESGEHDAVVALGALVRGATGHYDVLASHVPAALGQVALATGVPVALGLLTCDSMEQAWDRAGGKLGNKGAEAAAVALEMASLARELKTPRGGSAGRSRAAGPSGPSGEAGRRERG